MFSTTRLRGYQPDQWQTLWLLFPPLYGAWLLAVGPPNRLYRLSAWVLLATTAVALLGIGALLALGMVGVDSLLAALVALPWLPVALVWLLVLGTVVPGALCGHLLRQQVRKATWRWYVWPLALEALHDA